MEDFIIIDMPETDDAQIILGQPILTTIGCHLDVREGSISFEVEGCLAMFSHRMDDMVSPHSSILDALPLSPEIDMEDVWNCEDPLDSDWISYEDHNQEYVKVEFPIPMPPKKLEVEALVSNEYSMTDYCRFAQTVLSTPPVEGFDVDFDIAVERVGDSPSDRPQDQFVLYADSALWHQVMKIKDLQP